ncbi:MAG: hypothetical protein QM757_17080 [Paludibaculum sp.]
MCEQFLGRHEMTVDGDDSEQGGDDGHAGAGFAAEIIVCVLGVLAEFFVD